MDVDEQTIKVIAVTAVVVILLMVFINKFMCGCEKYENLSDFVPVEKQRQVLPDTSDAEKEARNQEQFDYIVGTKPF